ncbi:MAG: glycosyltransferase [Pedobacter sp.]|uniref:glycosyltransferase n=1 Tax=Pedobacter sp. TaxID=1411316 RepID=UPI002809B04E|nr:glycosyltransferase [Pedobacter sp.]MDQ8004973.1 glycosyltransferase [Pedobacter sp.]
MKSIEDSFPNTPKKPLISVALCTYNAGEYLEKQLLSIFAQTYKNIEIVVVDDRSNDGTYEYLIKLQEQNKQLKVFRNEFNLGFNKNFEKAISLCTGDFIAISDQDDIWIPEKLSVLSDNIGNNWLAFSNSDLIDKNDQPLGKTLLNIDFNISERTFKSIILNNYVTGHTTLFSKNFVKYFSPIPAVGYYDWWMGFIAHYHDKITYVNRCLTLYRVHHKSVIGSISSMDKKKLKKAICSDLTTQLISFKSYKNLTSKDRDLIRKIATAYQRRFSLYFVWIIISRYNSYLPDQKPRSLLARFFYALKFKVK